MINFILHEAEKRYQMIENVVLALILDSHVLLRPYFKSHQVVVMTNDPIKQVLQKPELARKMVAWSIELSHLISNTNLVAP